MSLTNRLTKIKRFGLPKALAASLLALSLGFTAANAQIGTAENFDPYTHITGTVDTGGIVNSQVALVVNAKTGQELYSKNANAIRPIASISKLLTALVIVRAKLPMNEMITITNDDVDTLKHSGSRLTVGTTLSRHDMLWLALMSSENRAAHALGRTYPGGLNQFVKEMNATARQLGMTRSHFIEPTGLSPSNVSTPHDLVRLLQAASKEPLIHQFTTSDDHTIVTSRGRTEEYHNSNRLVRNKDWHINLSKTGYIKEAGRCLVMMTEFDKQPVAVVLLNSQGNYTRFSDAIRVRHIVQNDYPNLF